MKPEIRIGSMERGPRNSICDVEGVLVGHSTLTEGTARTGVTAILPHGENLFREKVPAAAFVMNGFGKSAGLVQVAELGSIETPVVLTNTLCVGRAYDAIVEYSLERNPEIGISAGTVNPVVGECNDGQLNDIRAMHVRVEHVRAAIDAAGPDFKSGAVGAGTGMSCFGLKGGIGTSSRIAASGDARGTVGALVLSNFGIMSDLVVDGVPVGARIAREMAADAARTQADRGSIIMVLATDLPLSDRQLGRVARRAIVGLSRTGSRIGNGSGDIVIAFSTANRILAGETRAAIPRLAFNEDFLDPVFRAAAETVEEAILDSLLSATTTIGRGGLVRRSLSEFAQLF